MSAIGPDLPPHLLAKRKRTQEEQTEEAASTPSGAKHPPSPSNSEKKRRTIGPAMPPAPLNERPSEPVKPTEQHSDSEDEEFGPTLPKDTQENTGTADEERSRSSRPPPEPSEEKVRRDDWMTMPPKQDDLAARFDPNKRRPTKFNTGKGAKGSPDLGDDNSAWHETPEQKRKRLEDEMMGISKPASVGPNPPTNSSHDGKDAAAAKKVREQIEKTRGPSLIDKHKSRHDTEAEDDPSKRAFDRERDMGSGGRISSTQKREMLNKAAGFSSKFSGGTYL